MVTGADTPVLPAASIAKTSILAAPFGTEREFQLKLHGAAAAFPTILPLTRSHAHVTPTLSVALTVTFTVPDTAPLAGEMMPTVGLTVSTGATLATFTE